MEKTDDADGVVMASALYRVRGGGYTDPSEEHPGGYRRDDQQLENNVSHTWLRVGS
jgi:hypothetical protein